MVVQGHRMVVKNLDALTLCRTICVMPISRKDLCSTYRIVCKVCGSCCGVCQKTRYPSLLREKFIQHCSFPICLFSTILLARRSVGRFWFETYSSWTGGTCKFLRISINRTQRFHAKKECLPTCFSFESLAVSCDCDCGASVRAAEFQILCSDN